MEYNLRHRAEIVSRAQESAKTLKANVLIEYFESLKDEKIESLESQLAEAISEKEQAISMHKATKLENRRLREGVSTLRFYIEQNDKQLLEIINNLIR